MAGVAELKRRVALERGQSQDELLKTAVMMRLERRFNRDIRVLLAIHTGTGQQLAKRYGVSPAVISLWRKRLGIVNVPNPGQFKRVVA